MKTTVLMLGTFDSKAREFHYLYNELCRRGVSVLTMDVGVFPCEAGFPVHISCAEVAKAGGAELAVLRERADRGNAMRVMCNGARALALALQKRGDIAGIISMGGGGGTSIATTAMQALPVGFPKVCVTTLACGDTREYVGTRDILLFPSIVDICGVNRFSRLILSRAAGAICGMMALEPAPDENERPSICISMFGNSTQGVERCAELFRHAGYEPLVFHATGAGGRAMEEFVLEGGCAAVLDVTTTEWADELCGGILSAGKSRLDGPGRMGIPHLIVPGCLDMVNFGSSGTVPERYRNAGRTFYEWNPMVTLMRTNTAENAELGRILAAKANAANGPAAFLLPLRGLSILGGDGQPFCDRAADAALFEAIRTHVKAGVPVYTVDDNINGPDFASKAVQLLLEMLHQKG